MTVRDDILAIPNELLRSGNVTEATLVYMDFSTGARRFWTGWGDLDAGGETWSGTGDLISMSAVGARYDLSAQPMSFKLAATAEFIEMARVPVTTYRDRTVQVFQHMFVTQPGQPYSGDEWLPGASAEPWQPIGSPYAIFTGTMTQLSASFSHLDKGELTLTAEGLFVRRSAPPHGLWTDRDQQARHTGDKGCEFVAKYRDYNVRWF